MFLQHFNILWLWSRRNLHHTVCDEWCQYLASNKRPTDVSSPDLWGSHSPVYFLGLYLWLTELHQLQNISFQAVVFGSGVSEDVNERSRQGNLQGFLYSSYTHLRAVTPTLGDRITQVQLMLEKNNSKYPVLYFIQTYFMLERTLCNLRRNKPVCLLKSKVEFMCKHCTLVRPSTLRQFGTTSSYYRLCSVTHS